MDYLSFLSLDNFMIYGAEIVIYVTIFLMIFLSFKPRIKERRAMLLSILALPIGIFMIKIVHLFIYEPRPYVNLHLNPLILYYKDTSFPSVHTTLMSIVSLSYVYFKSKWAPLFLLLLFWVGISRVYTLLHYPSDIIGGFITGIVSLLIAKQISKLINYSFFR